MSKRKGLAKSCQPWKHICPAMRRKREGALARRKVELEQWNKILTSVSPDHAEHTKTSIQDKIARAKADIKNLELRLAR